MKLESQVCSLELARKLRELGVVQESAFYWSGFTNTLSQARGNESIAAFTVAELGVMLPRMIRGKPRTHQVHYEYLLTVDASLNGIRYEAETDYNAYDYITEKITADTEANARASMLCYLLENGIITVDEVNKRLMEVV